MLGGKYPRIATMWLDPWAGDPGEIEALAKHSVVVLSMGSMGYHPTLTASLRAINPNITIFGFIPLTNTTNWYPYIDGNGDLQGGAGNYSEGDLARLCPDYALSSVCAANDWFLRVAPTGEQEKGDILNYWGNGLSILNLTDECPLGTVGDATGLKLKEWLPGFWASLKDWPQWDFDGYYFDNVWDGIHTTGGNLVDLDQDGTPDPVAAALSFKTGVVEVLRDLRTLLPNDIIWGNAGPLIPDGAIPYMNGTWWEGIGTMLVYPEAHGTHDENNTYNYHWLTGILSNSVSKAYLQIANTFGQQPLISGINSAWEMGEDHRLVPNYAGRVFAADNDHYLRAGEANLLRDLRLWIGSASLGDGYLFTDNDDDGHCSAWWIEPYYSMDWGVPTGPYTTYVRGGNTIYRRDFTNGVVIVNPHNAAVPAEGEIPSIPAWDAFLGTVSYNGFTKAIRPAKTKVKRGTIRPH